MKFKRSLLLLLVLVTIRTYAQELVTVTGKVISPQKTGLSGVNVSVKNSSPVIGVTTDADGQYKIQIATAIKDPILVFSHVSFTAKEIKVGKDRLINVTLEDASADELDDVVVIGYGTANKKDLTGSVGTVNVKDMAKAPVVSFDQALAGRVAGVQVSSNEGQPGSEGINIVIRGNGSLTQSSAPLYVIDGFPIEDFNISSVAMDDIESITVLKDASSTAIYGSRGANGVIVVQTKKGKFAKPTISYSGSFGFQQVTKRMKVMSPYEFVRYQIELGFGGLYLGDGKTLDSYKEAPYIDWQDALYRTGSTRIHNISISGGSLQTKYSISGSAFTSDAVVPNSGNDKYSGRVAIVQTINDKLKVGVNASYSSTKFWGQQASLANNGGVSSSYLMYSTWGYRPVTGQTDYSLDDLMNNLGDDAINHGSDYRINPIISAKNEYLNNVNNNLIANGNITYNFTPELVLNVTGGLNNQAVQYDLFFNSQTARGTPIIPSNVRGQWGSKNYSERKVWTNENTLTYKKQIDPNQSFDLMGGFSMQGTSYAGQGLTATLVPNERLGIHGLAQGSPQPVTTPASENYLQSFLTRANYNYRSKYLFTATFRADGSSKFKKENRWGYFPSGALAWRMSNEPFMKNLTFVSDAKLRVSYGLSGNNRVGDYSYFPTLVPTNSAAYPFNNQIPIQGVTISNLGNADLKWETTKQIDIGYDLQLFKKRIELIVDVYRKTTEDLLLDADLPYNTGYSTVYKNIGKLQNQGLEITLNTINVKSKKFTWETGFNISFNKNKVLELVEGMDYKPAIVSWDGFYNNTELYRAAIGQPTGQFYGYVFDGIYQYEDFDKQPNGSYVLKTGITNNGSPRANVQPGHIRYKDMNGDTAITAADITVIGRGLPKHTGGFSNNFIYKGLSLGIFFQWAFGNDLLNANRIIFEGSQSPQLNQFATYADRWTPDNPSNTYFGKAGQGPTGMYSSRVIEDGSYLRLKTVSLDYAIPARYLKKIKMSGLSINAAAQNLYTWTNYSGMDPEVSTRNSIQTPGFDFSAYPRAFTVVFGLKATF